MFQFYLYLFLGGTLVCLLCKFFIFSAMPVRVCYTEMSKYLNTKYTANIFNANKIY